LHFSHLSKFCKIVTVYYKVSLILKFSRKNEFEKEFLGNFEVYKPGKILKQRFSCANKYSIFVRI
jgi:hypothetical protein